MLTAEAKNDVMPGVSIATATAKRSMSHLLDNKDAICPVCLDRESNCAYSCCWQKICSICRDAVSRLTPVLCPYCRTTSEGYYMVTFPAASESKAHVVAQDIHVYDNGAAPILKLAGNAMSTPVSQLTSVVANAIGVASDRFVLSVFDRVLTRGVVGNYAQYTASGIVTVRIRYRRSDADGTQS
jgi:hypothetical protein